MDVSEARLILAREDVALERSWELWKRKALANPGVADAPWIVRSDPLKAYLTKHPAEKLDAKQVEKVCVSLLPRNYMTLYPAKAGLVEFYR